MDTTLGRYATTLTAGLTQTTNFQCIAELRDKAAYYQQHGVVSVLDVMAGVVKADLDASDPFLEALRRGVRSMENMPGRLKDWHLHTDETVLDLVDPSLFPIVYGTTRVLPNGTLPREDCVVLTGVGEVVQGVFLGRDRVTWLFNPDNLVGFGHYQWLPCDVTFDQNRQANIEGYINNLHPQRHAELYPVLAAAVDKAVPMWNATLSWNSSDRRCRIQVNRCDFRDFQRPDHIEEDDWPDDDFIHNHPEELRLIQPSVARRYKPPTKYPTNRRKKPFDLIKDFPTGLQIIFKLMNVHLTPEKPTYGGSDWRVEGTLNEHICATALFYYDQENIEDGHLEFRHRIDTEDMVSHPHARGC